MRSSKNAVARSDKTTHDRARHDHANRGESRWRAAADECLDEKQPAETAGHEDFTVREVDELEHAVDECVAECDERIQGKPFDNPSTVKLQKLSVKHMRSEGGVAGPAKAAHPPLRLGQICQIATYTSSAGIDLCRGTPSARAAS